MSGMAAFVDNAADPDAPACRRREVLHRIDARRRELGVSIERLAAASEVTERHYRKAVKGLCVPRVDTLSRLRAGLARLANSPRADAHHVRSLYVLALTQLCTRAGVDVAAVMRQSPSRRATMDAQWMEAAGLRRRAVYLVNCAVGVPQVEVARAAGMTGAAVSLAVRDVEDERDRDPSLDALLNTLEALMMEE